MALTVVGLGRVLSVAGLGLEGLVSIPVVPLRVTGTLQEPHFETDVSGLPVAAWKLIPRTVGAARHMAEKGADVVIDAARGAGGLLRPGGGEPKTEEKEGD